MTDNYKLINFSHPLSAIAKNKLEKMIGGEIDEDIVHVQIDFTFEKKSLLEQLEEIMREVKNGYHFIIPPSLGAVAYCLSGNYDWCMGWHSRNGIYHKPNTVIRSTTPEYDTLVHIVPE